MTSATRADELVFDTWTTLSFKQGFGRRSSQGTRGMQAPTWVGDEHRRRLQAYTVLQAYIDNTAREFLTTDDRERRQEHREYGDAALFRNAVLSAVLGDEQTITVDGADSEDETAEAAAARQQQDWLETWADDERFSVKMLEVEQDAVGLGDGVYVLGWSAKKQRPRLRIFDPGFYFPVLDDGNEDEFPSRVHIAWEVPPDEREPGKVKIRRMTWELVPLTDLPPDEDGLVEVERDVDYQDDPITETCLLTDAVWTLDRNGRGVDDLTGATAAYLTNEDGDELNRLDLGIDFIPVVHESNTVAVKEHYGRSALAYILQILDDVANADTDLAGASATTGAPPIALSGDGVGGRQVTYAPGTVFNIGQGGRMDVLDTSKALDALLKQVTSLLDRMSVNGRMPAALLGRIDPSEVPSGVALALSFGPLTALVRELRLARREKYRLLFKFVHRLAVVGGVTDLPAEHIVTDLEFGAFLPNDEKGTVDLVVALLQAKAISLETAVALLREAGVVARDQQDELKAIQSRDFEGANRLFDATGNLSDALRYLGLTLTDREAPPGPPEGGQAQPPTPPGPPPDDDTA